MLSSMANMEAEIQVISTFNEMIVNIFMYESKKLIQIFQRLTTDVRFQFNENTRHAECKKKKRFSMNYLN